MLSIITSLYKSEVFLEKFISHAEKIHKELKERPIPFEHIIIANDISPFEEATLAKKDDIFTIIKVPRETIYATWNRGIQVSTGEYITFWNVDDIRFVDAFIDGIHTLENGYDATYFPFIYRRYITFFTIPFLVKKVTINPPEYNKALFSKEMHAGPFFIATKRAFATVGLFDESYRIAGDYAWWSRLAKSDLHVIKTNTVAGVFTNNGKTLSGSKNKLQEEENKRVLAHANSL